MALNSKDIIKRIRLALDPKATRDVRDKTKDALEKGTDPRKAKANLGQVEGGMKRVTGLALKLGGALAAAFGIRKIAQFGRESVKVAAEADRIWNKLGGTLSTVGVDIGEVRGEIDALARGMQDRTTMGDEDFAQVLDSLVVTTGDYAKSLANVSNVADVAAATGLDFRRASVLVGRALNGETTVLKRYGVELDATRDISEQLAERFGGLAENEAKSLAGQVAQVKNEFGDFQQAVGEALIAVSGGGSILTDLRDRLQAAAEWTTENRYRIAAWGKVAIESVKAVASTFGNSVRIFFNIGQAIGDALMVGLAAFVAEAGRALNWIPGIEIDVEKWHGRAMDRTESFLGNVRDIGDAVGDLAGAWIDVADAAMIARNEQRNATASAGARRAGGAGGGGGGGGGAGAGLPDPEIGLVGTGGLWDPAEHGAIAGEVESIYTKTLGKISKEAESTASTVGAIGIAFAQGGLEGLAQYAKGKVLENIAAGIEHVAKGVGAAASGNAPAASLHFKSAAEHGAAAAAWGALAATGGGGGAGGGAGAVSQGGRSDSGGAASERSSRAGGDLVIILDGVDPNNPRHQERIGETARKYRKRTGGDVYVNGRRVS